MPAIGYNHYGKVENLNGLIMLLMSPLGIFALNFAGLANITLFIARPFVSTRPLISLILSFVSVLLAMSLLLYDQMPMGSEGSFKFFVLTGYYVWLGSMLAAVIQANRVYENRKKFNKALHQTDCK